MLFGTLDMDDAQYFVSQIDKLHTTEKQLIQLTKNQTHIVMSDLHNVHRLISELVANVKENRAKVNELVSVLNEETLLNYTIVLSQYANSIENSLNHYITASQNFMAIIFAAQQGKLHPSLLSNCKFRAIVNEIHNSATQYEIPIPQEYLRIEEIVKIAPVTWKHKAGKLIFTVHIPLVNRVEYHLYQLHSLPILQNLSDNSNIWAYIHPQYPYLGLSNDHSTYFGTTETFLHTCIEIWHTYLCDLDIPLYEASISESCEISLLLRPQRETLQNCNIRIAPIYGTYWRRLARTRGWLYSIKEPETL
ncbi:Envelope fusion protein [Anthophora plagiata]